MATPHIANQPQATFSHTRLTTEFKTLTAMIHIYCKEHHDAKTSPCLNCEELLNYASKRLIGCPFQEKKPTCGKCPVHCYKKSMQDKVKRVMKYAGPKMIYRHPIMALTHLIDSSRKVPVLKKK